MLFNRETVIYRDKLYWVYRKVRQESIKEGYVNDVKEYWKCDLVVKNKQANDEVLLFLREIPELEII